jgi:hypothetical protein
MIAPTTLSERPAAPPVTPFLDITTYHPCYGLVIPAPEGTLRLDHIIVSRYGIFVIKTSRRSGWIVGDVRLPHWTSVYPGGARHHFRNPLPGGEALARALADVLEVPRRTVFPVVVFRGDCELADILPENVVTDSPAAYVRDRRQPLFTEEEVAELREKLKHLERKTSPAAAWATAETF